MNMRSDYGCGQVHEPTWENNRCCKSLLFTTLMPLFAEFKEVIEECMKTNIDSLCVSANCAFSI